MNLQRLCLLILTLLLASASPAQAAEGEASAQLGQRNMSFVRLDTLRGLSQDTVYAIVQDAYGFIWIGTEEGLNRYDGQKVLSYERDPGDPTSLTHNWIFSLALASNDDLWIGTDGGGINILDTHTESFRHIRHDPDDPSTISSDRIRALHETAAGYMWVGTVNDGLNRIDPATGEVVRYRHDENDPNTLPNDQILVLGEDRRGNLWVGTNGGGLARYDSASDSFTRYEPSESPYSLSGWVVSAIEEDRDGALWVGTRDAGLNRLNISTGQFEEFRHDPADPSSLSNDYVRAILEDRDGTLWVSTEQGLNEWRSAGRGFIHYFAKDSDPTSLSANRLTTLFQSSDGVLWVGSYRGVNTWNYLSDAFHHYRKSNGILNADTVTGIGESTKGQLWVGTYGGGLTGIDRLNDELTHLRAEEDTENTLSSDRIMAVFVDTSDRVWAGTRSSGLNLYDPADDSFQHFEEPLLTSNAVSAIFADTDGTVWVGTYGGGMNRIDAADRTNVTHFRHQRTDPLSLGGDRVLAIMRDRSGTLWVGTEDGGMNRFDPVSGSFQRFMHDPENPDSLSANTAWEITETSDGSLWIATKDDGLNQWRPEDRAADVPRFKKYTKSHGLRSNTVYGLLEDNLGQLWLSSNRGITRINLANYDMRHYDRRNGLIAYEFNCGARRRSRMGQLVVGGPAGAVAFDPAEIRHNTRVPNAVVRAYSPFERLAVSYGGREPEQPAQLSYSDNYVAFEFAALDYTSPDKIAFRYMLQGFDEVWQDPQSVRRVTYANLPAGRYTFRVRVANSDGVWNENGGIIPITVTPAPWFTTWAYGLYGILASLGLVFAFRLYRLRRAREAMQREHLEAMVQQRTSELGDRNRELEDLNNKLLQTSFRDSLTGLYNRRYMNQFIDRQINLIDRECFDKRNHASADFSRYQQTVLFFMMIDLDGFKAINDTHGHAAGDQALLQVRDQLLSCMRTTDTVIRWGGDEFLVVGTSRGLAGIANLAERVCLAISEHSYDLGTGERGYLSCSVGAVPYPFAPLKNEMLNWEQSLNLADAAAYVVKANGRNGWLIMNGTPGLSEDDARSLPATIGMLHRSNQLHLTTSLKEPIDLTGKRQSAA